MKFVALGVAILIGLFLSPATGGQDSDDETPDPVLICPTSQPYCDTEEPWTQRPPAPSRPSHSSSSPLALS